MSQAASAEEQLLLLRALTMVTGEVTDLQLDHLRLWGRAAVPHCISLKMGVDIENWLVQYNVEFHRYVDKMDPNILPDPELLAALARSVRWLLGDGYTVSVITNVWSYKEEGDLECQTRSLKRPEIPTAKP